MTDLWLPAATSAAVTAASAPMVRTVLLRSGTLDIPNHRSSHTVPTPRGGGIACLLGVVAGAMVAELQGLSLPYLALAACALVALAGLLDDRFTLPPLPRLAAQIAFGCVAAWAAGVPMMVLGALLFPVVVNAVNFMDGINGITGLVALVWGLTAAYLGAVWAVSELSLVGLLTAGAALGFLPFNALRARLFLGDAGSYLFGGLCAVGILIGLSRHVPVAALVAPLALYFVDVFLTLARRLRARQPLLTAHRDHIYQRLAIGGLEHIQVAAIVLGLSALLAACWVFLPAITAIPLTVVTATMYVMLPEIRSRQFSHSA